MFIFRVLWKIVYARSVTALTRGSDLPGHGRLWVIFEASGGDGGVNTVSAGVDFL